MWKHGDGVLKLPTSLETPSGANAVASSAESERNAGAVMVLTFSNGGEDET